MDFEWDPKKEQDNIKNHGVSFYTAIQIWRDPIRIERYDDRHSGDEDLGRPLDCIRGFLRLFIHYAGIKLILSARGKHHQQKGGPIMALVTYTLDIDIEPTAEEQAAIIAELEAAEKLPFFYDPEYPPLTKEQLAQFHPVNGMTWEERARIMRERGIVDPDAQEPAARIDVVRVPVIA
jgi:uncharacterized DUF497 family protein